jgi:hypothetical protein
MDLTKSDLCCAEAKRALPPICVVVRVGRIRLQPRAAIFGGTGAIILVLRPATAYAGVLLQLARGYRKVTYISCFTRFDRRIRRLRFFVHKTYVDRRSNTSTSPPIRR